MFEREATYRLGPQHGQLTVHTGTGGPAARAGHELAILAAAWEAVFELSGDPTGHSVAVSVDPSGLVVVDGRGGATSLTDDDKAGIGATIRDEILGAETITFESRHITVDRARGILGIDGALELNGVRREISFELAGQQDQRITGGFTLTQSASTSSRIRHSSAH